VNWAVLREFLDRYGLPTIICGVLLWFVLTRFERMIIHVEKQAELSARILGVMQAVCLQGADDDTERRQCLLLTDQR